MLHIELTFPQWFPIPLCQYSKKPTSLLELSLDYFPDCVLCHFFFTSTFHCVAFGVGTDNHDAWLVLLLKSAFPCLGIFVCASIFHRKSLMLPPLLILPSVYSTDEQKLWEGSHWLHKILPLDQ